MKKGIVWCLTLLMIVGGAVVLYSYPRPSGREGGITVAIVNPNAAEDPMTRGFLSGLAEGGYREGENLTLLRWEKKDGTAEALAKMVSARPDLIFTVSTPVTWQAMAAVTGRQIPVVFVMNDPVGSGIIESLARPGGDLTGIQVRGSTTKAMEWLLAVAPHIKHLYVPVAYDSKAALQAVADLRAVAEPMGIGLSVAEVRSEAELDRALATMPADVDAGFIVHSDLIASHLDKIVAAARARGIPLGAAASEYADGATVSFGIDRFRAGLQASSLARQVLDGAAPADVPAEVATFFLGINLKTARAAGIKIPNDVLPQADFVVR